MKPLTANERAEAKRILDRSRRRGGVLESGEISRLLVLLPRLLDELDQQSAPAAERVAAQPRPGQLMIEW